VAGFSQGRRIVREDLEMLRLIDLADEPRAETLEDLGVVVFQAVLT